MTAPRPRPLARLTHLPLALCLGAALATSASAQSLLTLVEQAQSYDAAWQSAQAQWRAASSRADQARAGLLPSAALAAGVGTARTEISRPEMSMTLPNRSVSVSASQPLYRPANRIGLEQSQRGIDIAQAQLDAATQDLLVRVSQAYFDVLAAQDTLTFVRAQKTARTALEAGAATSRQIMIRRQQDAPPALAYRTWGVWTNTSSGLVRPSSKRARSSTAS